jgi:hypothetical protein
MAKDSNAIRILRSCAIAIFVVLLPAQMPLVISAFAAEDSPASPVIILGFVGGFVRHDDMVRDEVRFAARLRKQYPSGVVVETFENRNGESAHRRIMTLLDANHDGTLSAEEKRGARIILYGHSWGAAEVVSLARQLERDGIPVLLTIQVDSVSKLGQNDELIPANVAQAVNFYQADGLLHGTAQIRAADPARTRIIGNFQFRYADTQFSCANYPWYLRLFMNAHTQIECDPKVWDRVEALVHSAIQGPSENEPKQKASRP